MGATLPVPRNLQRSRKNRWVRTEVGLLSTSLGADAFDLHHQGGATYPLFRFIFFFIVIAYLETPSGQNFSRGLTKAPFCVRRRKLGSPKNRAAFLLFRRRFSNAALKSIAATTFALTHEHSPM